MTQGSHWIGWLRAVCPVVALAAVGGCATAAAGRVEGPRAVPAAWTSTGDGIATGPSEDLSRWWERLGDTELSSLIDRALDGSIDVRTAQARLRQARAQWKVTDADRFPSVSASVSPSATNTSRVAANGFLSGGIDAAWEPDVFGARANASHAAAADVAATEADLHGTRVSLVAEVALNYVELRLSQARLQILERNLATQSETLQLTIWRAQAGLVTELDVSQARANREQTAAEIPRLDTSMAEARHRIAVLVGLPPGALGDELSVPTGIPAAPEQVMLDIPAETLRQRPDVRASEQRVAAETARLAAAGSARYPSFSLNGSFGFSIVAGAATGGASLVQSLAAGVFQNVFTAGRIRGQIDVQSAVQEQAIAGYEATVLAAFEEVENALVAFSNSRSREAALERAADAAREAASLARLRYQAGLTDFQSVLDTERTVLSVEDALVTSQGDRTSAVIRLYKALGGGWTPEATPAVAGQEGRTS